jgi:hypothetical protein
MGNSSVNGPFSRTMLNSQRVYVPDFLRISHNMYTREISRDICTAGHDNRQESSMCR